MAQDSYKKKLEDSMQSSAGLFDNIICAIKEENQQRQTRNILGIFILLFVISLTLLPFTFNLFIDQWHASGSFYFISNAFENFNIFSSLWQDFTLSILESLPILPIILLAANIALFLFTVRLFLYRKGLLLKYLHLKT